VEEARQQALKQGVPVSQVRQLPTKFQLGNNRATHVRKWFDREPTLAKKFLRAAGLICSKSNGTFIKEHVRSLEDLPLLIRTVDLSRCDESSGDDGEDGSEENYSGSPVQLASSGASISVASSPSPSGSPLSYQPKLKVYYHPATQGDKEPFVFKVPITDLKNMDEFHNRLTMLLREMGQISADAVITNKLVISTDSQGSRLPDDSSSMEDLSQRPLIHVYAQG